jgi:hypothetical protein
MPEDKKFYSLEPTEIILATYAPMIYTAPYVMFLMRADPLRGHWGGGGGGPWKSRLFWALKWQREINRKL